jgi:hypothetical protein
MKQNPLQQQMTGGTGKQTACPGNAEGFPMAGFIFAPLCSTDALK